MKGQLHYIARDLERPDWYSWDRFEHWLKAWS